MYARRVVGQVKRSACVIAPAATSSNRARPAKIGRPAASAEVHPAGRIALDERSKMAPDPAVQLEPPFTGLASNSSYNFQLSTSSTITWRSPDALAPPSIGAPGGIGYGPGSLSSPY